MNPITNPRTMARLRRQYAEYRLRLLQASMDRYAVSQGWGVWDGEKYQR